MLELKHIDVSFDHGTKLESNVLKSLNLKVAPGEFVTLIGSNGAGKSTLFNVIDGSIRPIKGQILIDGKECTHWPSYKRAALIAKVVQDPHQAVIDAMTIEENLAFAMARGKWRTLLPALRKERREFFQERLQELEMNLGQRLNDLAGTLSGGQRQALSLMMATLVPSKLLLLDEHTAALDPKVASRVMDITANMLKHHNLTAIMITHNMNHALKYGNRTLVMHEGKIVRELSLQEKQQMKPADLVAIFDTV